MKRFVLFAITTVLFFSCKKSSSDAGGVIIDPVIIAASTQLNIAYGTDPLQKMDIYLPAGRSASTTKSLIVIHPGSWFLLDKNTPEWLTFIDSLKTRLPSYAIFNVNHRLASLTGNLFPAQENDIKAAVDFINARKSDYLVADKFVMLGASSGAHLALLQGYKYTTPKAKAIVDLFGPTDMVQMYLDPASASPASGIALLMSGTPASNPTLYQSSSPINFVDISSPPTIIFHGGNLDTLVKTNQSVNLRSKLLQKAVINQYYNYPGEGHGWIGANLTDTFDKIVAFLNANVL
jgi:acetyl esterase/lipase